MTPADEFVLDTPAVRSFSAQVRAVLADSRPGDALRLLKPAFAALLADPNWLPDAYRRPAGESTMGGGIASWLLFRAGDGGLSLFSLVVPAGAATPVHDHLAWGLGSTRGSRTRRSTAGRPAWRRGPPPSNWPPATACGPATSTCSSRRRGTSTGWRRRRRCRR